METWIPLVTWEMGTSSTARLGQTWDHILRATSPCSALTPLQCSAMRRPRTNIDIGPSGDDPLGWPQERISSTGVPSRGANTSRTGVTISGGNSSWPAATGVWVVKMVVRGMISSAVRMSTPWRSMVWASRSMLEKAECPSVIWMTRG